MRLLILFFALSISWAAAAQDDKNSNRPDNSDNTAWSGEILEELEQQIVGVWTNVSMLIHVNTYQNSDTSFIVDINEHNWDQKMTIQPIVTTIHEDGTYESEFRNSFDSLMYTTSGTWMLDGDTLLMEDHQGAYKYQIFIDGDRAEFRSLIDYDQDEHSDDRYFGVQRKIE